MKYLIRFSVLLTILAIISCNGSDDNDTPVEDTAADNSSGSSYSIAGLKTMAVEYSTAFDAIAGDTAQVVSGEIPVEEHGFITMSASSTGDIIIAGAAHGNLYYSDDGGITWYTLEGIGVQEYWTGATVSADGQDMAVSGGNFYVSHDSGETWTVYAYDTGSDNNPALHMSDDGKTIVTGTILSGSGNLYISYDYGDTWTECPLSNGDFYLAGFDVSGDGQYIAGLYEYEPLKLSGDSGETWADATSFYGQWSDIDISPDGEIIALLDAGSIKYGGEKKFDIYLSFDYGESWTPSIMVEGINSATAVSMTSDGSRILVSGINTDDPLMLSEDYGASWVEITTLEKENPNWPHYTHVFSDSGNRIVAMEHEFSVWTSDDLGQTWIKRLEGQGAE